MANEKNLVPQNLRSKEERKKISSAGGKASVKARQQKKQFAEWAKIIGQSEIPAELAKQFARMFPEQKNISWDAAAFMSMYRSAAKGDVGAFKAIADVHKVTPAHNVDEEEDELSKALKELANEL